MKHTLLIATTLAIALLASASALMVGASSALNAASVTGLTCIAGLALTLVPVAAVASGIAGYKLGLARALQSKPPMPESAHALPHTEDLQLPAPEQAPLDFLSIYRVEV